MFCVDEDEGDWGSNPFADEPDDTESMISTNPFDEPDIPQQTNNDPEDEYEEIEEWVDEVVTDEESEVTNDSGPILASPQFGNQIGSDNFSFGASNKLTSVSQNVSFEIEEEISEIALASEASLQTPLHLAVWNKHENIVQLMLEFRKKSPDRISLDEKNSFEQTAFALSLWLGLKCSDDLLKAGSNINDKNIAGESLLQQAIVHQDSTSALFLLDRNADFSFRTTEGESPLMLAIKRHLPLVVDAFCIRGNLNRDKIA